jgi:hypothetical protein
VSTELILQDKFAGARHDFQAGLPFIRTFMATKENEPNVSSRFAQDLERTLSAVNGINALINHG